MCSCFVLPFSEPGEHHFIGHFHLASCGMLAPTMMLCTGFEHAAPFRVYLLRVSDSDKLCYTQFADLSNPEAPELDFML